MRAVKQCIEMGMEWLMRLWPSMMQNIHTKQEEEKWSLYQYNFLAGSRKTVHSLDVRKIAYKVKRKTAVDFRRW